MIPPSMGNVASAGYSTPSPLCGVHLFGDKDFVDACIIGMPW